MCVGAKQALRLKLFVERLLSDAMNLEGQPVQESLHISPKIDRFKCQLSRDSFARGQKRLSIGMRITSAALQVEIPEWYSRGHLPPAEPPPAPDVPPAQSLREAPLHFSVLEGQAGGLDRCEDSLAFLELLGGLHGRAGGAGGLPETAERRAARGLFRFDVRMCSPSSLTI